ncbi:MAG: NAD-dependent epimerase/dehydratase family protein [Treponema sp.]|jgi:nucleoside-diphosphate-sugar epimerase|nr:NAD-dependent epimerase/dehydratase family protein [Treponema sp.]
MNVLFIGGTGTISAAISKRALELGWNLFLLNRGSRNSEFGPGGTGKLIEIVCDIRTEDEAVVAGKIKAALARHGAKSFDVVADFIAFSPDHVEKDYRLFRELCGQYIFISSASAYQKPSASYLITESTPLANPLWKYSQDKISCEDFLMEKYRENGFPITIVRPSHTYDERKVPLGVHGNNGSWQVLKRMLDGKPVIIQGDGTSLWTMTHTSDFARAFTCLMGNIHAAGQAVQITSDETLCWNQIYQAIAGALNVPLKAVHISSDFLADCGPYDFRGSLTGDKAVSAVFDNTKLKRLAPGWCARIRFDQGIRETAAYMLAHKECQLEDPEFDAWCDKVITARERALRELWGGA